jgi:probable phosphoglycerate mutase
MTTRLFLIRHGATSLTAEDKFSGADNVHLSEEGRQQAGQLALRLASEKISALYSSPFDRAIETATILGGPHKLQPIPSDGMREISHGHWEGLTRLEVETRFQDEYAAWESDPFTFAPAGGESGISVLARSLPVIREIVVRHEGQSVMVVSHKATLRLLISSLLGFDGRGYRDRLDQAPACLNILDFKDPIRARLMLFNDISHYAGYPGSPHSHLSKWWDSTAHGRAPQPGRARASSR